MRNYIIATILQVIEKVKFIDKSEFILAILNLATKTLVEQIMVLKIEMKILMTEFSK